MFRSRIRVIFMLVMVFVCSLIVHESGHYFAAKSLGVRVERFAIGWGQSILSIKWHETEFAIAAIPIGAQVTLFSDTLSLTSEQEFAFQLGLVPEAEMEELRQRDPALAYQAENFKRSFIRQDPFDRAMIIFAGPICNLIFAFLLTLIAVFIPNSSPQEAEANERQHPFMSDEADDAFIDALILPWLFFGRKVKAVELTGPLGILSEGIRRCAGTWQNVLIFASSLNVGLAYFNLLPLCPLDGGRLSILALDAAAGTLSPLLRHNIEAGECWIALAALVFVIISELGGRRR